ncbi:MAG: hypothetical protein PWQ82_1842 [Thermosediminibacterales bacterium]|nr:hypothetical protein [Thermosediminibacterales bacterium]
MNELQKVFNYEGQSVRTIIDDGEPWFVAKDVCDVLDIAWRGQQTLVNIREDWKGVRNFRTPGGIQEMIVIKEPAVYKLAFRSRKEEAERFTDWVAGEVIPSIRKTGRYELYPHKPQCIEDLIIMQAQSVKELKARVEKQEKMLQIAQHRLDNLDAVNLEGDLRQRLNQMIKKYAFERGITFNKAWGDFKQAFNLAYKTNIELLKTNYFKSTGREVSTPEILEFKGLLEDAIRVADKMLNQSA